MEFEVHETHLQALYSGVLATALDAIIMADRTGRIIEFNPAAEEIFGYTRQEVISRPLMECVIPDRYREAHATGMRQFAECGHGKLPGKRIEVVAMRKGGEEFPVELTVSRIEHDGNVVFTAFIRDITERARANERLTVLQEQLERRVEERTAALTAEIAERRQAEERLRQSQRMLELVMDTIPQVIFWKDRNSQYLGCNRNFAHAAGVSSPDEIVGKTDYEMPWTKEESDFYRSCDKRIMDTNTPEFRIRETQLTADGQQTIVETNKAPLHDDAGNVIGILGTYEDITERVRVDDTVRDLNQALERRLSHLQCLRQIDLSISGNAGLLGTLELVTGIAVSQLDVDAACILLLDDDVLRYGAGTGFFTSAVRRTEIEIGQRHTGRAGLGQIVKVNLKDSNSSRAELLADERFVSYFGVPLVARGKVHGVLDVYHRSDVAPDNEWMDFLETLAGQAAIAIENATLLADLQHSNAELVLAYDRTIEGWSRALDLRDNETEGHTQRVTALTLKLASHYGIPENELMHIKRGALLHDIGKMGIPDHILLKPGPLTPEEWEIMRLHPVYAKDLLEPIDFLQPAIDIPYCHHEKWDGTGYPRGLRGEDIPLSARLFAIVDVWDALRSDRPYRAAWSRERTIDHILSLSGTHFEPAVVETFLSLVVEEPAFEERRAA
jgi:PAS domain S-box-containing protein